MIDIDIPGFGSLHLAHLVMDYNGTLALDGHLIDGVKSRLSKLGKQMQLHVITADTFGDVDRILHGVDCRLHVLRPGLQDTAKMDYVHALGAKEVVSIGNGRNDCLMLQASVLGIGLIQLEGACGKTLVAADVICASIIDALDLILHPLRLTATLRS
jgi:soluble P-type ATPase